MHDLAHEVRGRYRTLIITTWAAAIAAVLLLIGLGTYVFMGVPPTTTSWPRFTKNSRR